MGIGGGCSKGGGGKISDQFGTNRWLFWLEFDDMVRFLSGSEDIEVRIKSTVSFCGTDTKVFPF